MSFEAHCETGAAEKLLPTNTVFLFGNSSSLQVMGDAVTGLDCARALSPCKAVIEEPAL